MSRQHERAPKPMTNQQVRYAHRLLKLPDMRLTEAAWLLSVNRTDLDLALWNALGRPK